MDILHGPLQQALSLRTGTRLPLNLLPLQSRENKSLTTHNLPLCPGHRPRPRSPPQRPNPRLHIPTHRQRHILSLRQSSRNITNLILGLLAPETQYTRCHRFCGLLVLRRSASRTLGVTLSSTLALRRRGARSKGSRKQSGSFFNQIVPGIRGRRGRDDRVPDYSFGGAGLRVCVVRGGVCGVDVNEELFCVPVEEWGQVCVEVEADLGVFFAFGGVVVWSAFDAVCLGGMVLAWISFFCCLHSLRYSFLRLLVYVFSGRGNVLANRRCKSDTYTWTFFNCTEAVVVSVGNRSTESAANPATTRATVVKKPKTACRRLRDECIAARGEEVWSCPHEVREWN